MAENRRKAARDTGASKARGISGDKGTRGSAFRHRTHYFGFLAFVSIGAALLVTFFFCPNFLFWRGLEFDAAWTLPEVHRAVFTLEQIEHPFDRVENRSNQVIAWRLLFPAIWYYLGLPRWLFLVMPFLGCLLTLGLTAHIVFQRTANRKWTFFAAVLMAACPWFFSSTGWLTYFDSWVMGGMLLLAFGNSRVVLVLACLLTPWIEERFLLAAPLCFLIRAVDVGPGGQRKSRDLRLDGVAVLAASLAYPVLRAALAQCGVGSAETGAYAEDYLTWKRIATVSPIRYVEGAWMALRAGWFFAAVVLWSLWVGNRRPLSGLVAVGLLGTVAVGLLVAQDLSRNTGLVVPLALVGVVELARRRPDVLRIALPAVAAANLFLPAAHITTSFRESILYLYAQRIIWEHPPPEFDPDYYAKQGMQLLSQGKLDQAMSRFDDAINLDRGFGPAYVARAMMRKQLGDLEGASQDVERAIQLNAKDYDAHFVRALIRGQRRDKPGAVSDLQAAMQEAPAKWPRWQEAKRLMAEWNADGPADMSQP